MMDDKAQIKKDSYLENINSPKDLKRLKEKELKVLAEELRSKIIDVTAKKGGHLAASLGAVDLTVALHYCLNSPEDKIVFDVGHQAYAHKLLTGRSKNFDTLREMGGISGFPNKDESEYDPFTCGHSATSISSSLGLAMARDFNKEKSKVFAVIGDASIATGLAFEGMNHAGHTDTNLVVVLNDNEQFISKPVGAMSRYLNTVISNPLYNKVMNETEKAIQNIPKLGPLTVKAVKKLQESMKNLLVPGIVFEELGFRYFGPIDGHDIEQIIATLKNINQLEGPIFLHVITKKGKGYKYAEDNPSDFHGVNPFDVNTGKIEGAEANGDSFTGYFSRKIVDLAQKNEKVVAITAAMPGGTGLKEFSEKFPERFIDVGITEGHAVTLSAGLARGGMMPVVAIYSTFLQRSYDQLVHDIALQDLPVVFCVDRAGIVGKDGPTHHGVFDITYSRILPNFIVMAPKDGAELEIMLEKALEWKKPVLIRYPRAHAKSIVSASSCSSLTIGSSETLRQGRDLTLLACGSMVNIALRTAEVLSKEGIEAEVINARFIKPLDKSMLERISKASKKIYTLEEGIAAAGFGSAVLEFMAQENIQKVNIKCLGLPDIFIEHGSREELLRKYHLTPDEIALIIKSEL